MTPSQKKKLVAKAIRQTQSRDELRRKLSTLDGRINRLTKRLRRMEIRYWKLSVNLSNTQ